jgi:hypothetical protein
MPCRAQRTLRNGPAPGITSPASGLLLMKLMNSCRSSSPELQKQRYRAFVCSSAFESTPNGAFVFCGSTATPKPLKLWITTEEEEEA